MTRIARILVFLAGFLPPLGAVSQAPAQEEFPPPAPPWTNTGSAIGVSTVAAPPAGYAAPNTAPNAATVGSSTLEQRVVPAEFHAPAQALAPRPTLQRSPDDPRLAPVAEPTTAIATLPPRRESSTVRLPPRGAANATSGRRGGLRALVTTGGALAVALGFFLVLAWVMRRAAPRGATLLPREVLEVLGRAPLAARQQVHLVRCGRKLLLVCVTPAGTETLTEITEPEEVDRLAGLCRAAQPGSSTAAFRNMLDQFSREVDEPELEAPASAGRYATRSLDAWEARDV